MDKKNTSKKTDARIGAPAVRLDEGDWTKAALKVLAEQGIDAVRVEALAKILSITKGSFYWHFKDREALLSAMLDDWRRRATSDIIARLERTDEPAEMRLRKLFRLPFLGPRSKLGADVELSIRIWGKRDPRVRSTLEEVDSLRLGHIRKLLQEAGVPEEECAARAVIAYSFIRVSASLIDPKDDRIFDQCVAALIQRRTDPREIDEHKGA